MLPLLVVCDDPIHAFLYDSLGRRIVRKTYVSGAFDETRRWYWTSNWPGIEERLQIDSTSV